ncbi:acetylornithine aminotransferase [Candidatus Kaiserbacteria bacterium RIFCSPLOWO2_01_FULL_54_13]|uniref:Acetylornithine aminotransferase n=1 Tax=Candidatus Kaiserbacteria bacterium RIFCSPLOWO2_01_FULL_54_13 TaxID=1798512 RepID=A0A1F6F423_9BACT|nr:MAG: acetylornithine aminotransferase [Candidatus Kaiserbacteria bacterium RIFCSPLOWO2_01_FULL_54_13]
MNAKKILKFYGSYVMPTYVKYPLVISRGLGSYVWDESGKKYLDFFPGWGVSGLGHCHPRIVSALTRQARTLIHVANNYYHEGQALLARKIVTHSFPGKVFFCNSGAEANEGAIKLARKFGNPRRNEVITTLNSFHGRTIAAVTATGQKKFQKGFEPLPRGFRTVPFNDFSALKRAVSKKTIAIMLEPIQGEGGVVVAEKSYLKSVRKLCDEKNMLLIFDEVQTGMGRTGEMFCFKNLGVVPDILTLAKSLGGGFPIGAFVARKRIANTLQPGTHGTTFGGSPLACAAGLATFDAIDKEHLLHNAKRMGAYLLKKLGELKKKHSLIREVRGVGLMTGLELTHECKNVYRACLKRGLLINCTQGNVLRIMPPLVVNKRQIDQGISILDEALKRG